MSEHKWRGLAKVLRDRSLALLVEIEDSPQEFWIPKSLIDDDSEVFDGDSNSEGELVIPQWLAEKKGMC